MKTFQYLRANEMRAMGGLGVGGYELADEPVLWKEHVLGGLCGLVNARAACCSLFRDVRAGAKWTVLSRAEACNGNGHGRLPSIRAESGFGDDPMWEMAGEKGELVTRLRREVVDDAHWYG